MVGQERDRFLHSLGFFLIKQLIARVRPKWYIANHSVDK